MPIDVKQVSYLEHCQYRSIQNNHILSFLRSRHGSLIRFFSSLKLHSTSESLVWKGGCCLSPLPQKKRPMGRPNPTAAVKLSRSPVVLSAEASGRASGPLTLCVERRGRKDDDVPQMSLTLANDALHKAGNGRAMMLCLSTPTPSAWLKYCRFLL